MFTLRIVVIVVQLPSYVRLFMTPCTAAHQLSLSVSISRNLPKLMSIESVMPSNYLILCCLLLLLSSVFPSIRAFSNESLHQVAKVLELQLQHQPFPWIFRTDFLYNWLVWSPCSPRDQMSTPILSFSYIGNKQSLGRCLCKGSFKVIITNSISEITPHFNQIQVA